MKKIWIGATSSLVAVGLLLSGCTSTAGPSHATSSATGTKASSDAHAKATSKKIKVAFVSQVQGIPYFSGMQKGAEQEASRLGITFTQEGPSTANAADQVQIFNSLVQEGYNAISISVLDPQSINSAIAAARAKGVTVITADADAPASSRELFVSQASDQALGATAMDQIAKQTGKRGDYAIVSGAADTQTFNNWIAAIKKRQAEAYPKMKLVGGVRYTQTTSDALQQAQELMTSYPDLKGIIAIPSTAVPGVAQAVQNAGDTGKIAVTGFGSPETSKPFVDSGVMKSTVLWNVTDLGKLTVWAMDQLAEGKKIAASNRVPGLPGKISYDSATKILLLGKPVVFTKQDIGNFDY